MKKIWLKFKHGLFTKMQFLTGVTIVVVVTSTIVYAYTTLTLVNFGSGQQISSSDVNSNFSLLNERLAKRDKRFSFGLSGNKTVPPGGTLVSPFDLVHYDYSSHDYATNNINANGYFVMQDSGFYRVTLALGAVTTFSDVAALAYTYNASLASYTSIFAVSPWMTDVPQVAEKLVYFAAGQTILMKIQNQSASPQVVSASKTKIIFEKID